MTIDHEPWARAEALRAAVVPLGFPDHQVDVTTFGAVGDGVTDCTLAFQRAIRAVAEAGGGRVTVPAGRFATGPIRLLSHIELHVSAGATVAFSTDPLAYLPAVRTRFEGVELMGYSPLIYALDQEHIAVTGEGTLDGQADRDHWWPWKGQEAHGWRPGQPHQAEARDRLFASAERQVPVENRIFTTGSYLRPSFVQPYRCRDVLIDGVTLRNSPMWIIHPVLCDRVLVQGVTVDSHGPNSDGCDPESCRDVVVRHCRFDTGDDCIAIKSGRNADGRRLGVATERVLIEHCEFRDGHGGVTLGSEISAGVRAVFAQDLHMSSPALDVALRFKTNSMRGGFIDDVHLRAITVDAVARAAIEMDLDYEEGPGHGFNPDLRDIHISDLTVRQAHRAVMLRGYPDAPIHDVSLSDIRFEHSARPEVVEHVRGLAIRNVRTNGRHLVRGTGSTPPGPS